SDLCVNAISGPTRIIVAACCSCGAFSATGRGRLDFSRGWPSPALSTLDPELFFLSPSVAVISTTVFARHPHNPPFLNERVCSIPAPRPSSVLIFARAAAIDSAWYVRNFIPPHDSMRFDFNSMHDFVVREHSPRRQRRLNQPPHIRPHLRRYEQHG